MLHIIPDGYTEEGYIAEVPGLHPALRFAYRPMLNLERDVLQNLAAKESPQRINQAFTDAAVSRLQSWGATDQQGDPLAINAKNFSRLRPALFNRVYNIIAGYQPSDPDPAKVVESDEERQLLEAVTHGRPIGEVRQEEHEGNSDAG